MGHRQRSLFTLLAMVALLAAACGKNSDTKASTSGGQKPNAVTTTTVHTRLAKRQLKLSDQRGKAAISDFFISCAFAMIFEYTSNMRP